MTQSKDVFRILTLIAVIALLGVTLMGCPPVETEEEVIDVPIEDPAEIAEAEETTDDETEEEATDMAEMETVEITLVDGEIQMPDTLSAGMYMFDVTNEGELVHNVEIEGQDIEAMLDEDLQPGESGMLSVELEPGEYEVYCPVGDHAEQGMQMSLTVTEGDADAEM
ncbi:MAG: cupredoxin domain-containing protein [Armatimonadota bacterium]